MQIASTELKEIITKTAFELGFDGVGVTLANNLIESHNRFIEWREKGFAADMQYLLRDDPINAKPRKILPEALSVVSLFVNYYTKCPPCPGDDYGRVASYAVGIDYHKVIKKKIKLFREKVEKEIGRDFLSRGFTDAVPLLEKSFAHNSGNGFQGKHTILINKSFGSYFFISDLITNLELDPSERSDGTCGNCTRCQDICPTDAIPEPYQLDARKCISYLTIENRGSIDEKLRSQMGEWLFGCDMCQEICPYNKKAKETSWEEFKPSSGVGHWIKLSELLSIRSDDEFHEKYCRTPLTRPKRRGILRNAAIVAGNKKSKDAHPVLLDILKTEEDPIILEHAKWALEQY